MSDEEKAKGVVSALLGLIDKDTKNFLNVYLFMLIPLLFFFAFIGLNKLISKIDEPREECWVIEKIENKHIKLNKCTGEVKPLNLEKAE